MYGLINNEEGQRLVQLISRLGRLMAHPMLLPFIVAQVRMEAAERQLTVQNNRVITLEHLTGHHPYKSGRLVDPLKLDFTSTIKDLNGRDTDLGIIEIRLESCLSVLSDILTHMDAPSVPNSIDDLKMISQELSEQIAYLQSQGKSMLLRVHHLRKKVSTQLAVVSHQLLRPAF